MGTILITQKQRPARLGRQARDLPAQDVGEDSRPVLRARCLTLTDRVQAAHHFIPLSQGGDPDGEGIPMCFQPHRAAHAASRLIPHDEKVPDRPTVLARSDV